MRESITPWYEVYLKTYLKTMPASSVELFHVPIACVVVLSASIKQPVDVLTKMQATWVHVTYYYYLHSFTHTIIFW